MLLALTTRGVEADEFGPRVAGQHKSATLDQAKQDARNLMDTWNLQPPRALTMAS
jgi:hypothetical protein